MAWITLSAAHVLDRMADDERHSYEATGGNAAGDRLAGILTQVTALVRGRVSACSENIIKMGAAGTIPDELLWAAATIARASLVHSVPTLEGDNDPRAEELRQANRQLEDAAACKLGIESESGSVTDSVGTYGGNTYLQF